eukprot:SAG11_NODE_747_length_7366_cov_7.215632_6_plen_213_part_00
MSASEPAPAPEPEAEHISADVATALLAAVQDLTASVKETRAEQQTQGTALNTLSASLAQVVGAVATLNGSVGALQAAPAGAVAEKKEEDPRDILPYVPYFDARDENPHPEWPRGISDRPQLYQLTKATSPTYGYLRKKKNAAYHELATTACILSYAWDSMNHAPRDPKDLSKVPLARGLSIFSLERSCKSRSGVAWTREAILKGSFRPTSVG